LARSYLELGSKAGAARTRQDLVKRYPQTPVRFLAAKGRAKFMEYVKLLKAGQGDEEAL